MTTRVLIYTRISRDRTGRGLGVARQREDCEKLAQQLGWEVVGVREDDDVSAYSGKRRPAYRQMLDDLEHGRANAVLAWHADRLHRSPRELEEFVDLAERRSISVRTVQAGDIDLSSPSGRAVARTLGAWARYESEHKAERVRRAQLQATQAGKWTGGARPFGWKFADGKPVLEPSEAHVVRNATRAVLAGGSLRSTITALNDREVTTVAGKRWTYATMRQVLTRSRNAGLASWKGEIVGTSQFPAIVSEDEWRAVLAILAAPERRKSQSNLTKHLLAGIAKCHCGASVKSATASGRKPEHKRTIYRCRETGPGHVGKNAADVDHLVSEVVIARLTRPDALDLLSAVPDDDASDIAQEIRQRLDDLTNAFAEGLITIDMLKAGTAKLREGLADAESRLTRQATEPSLAKILIGPGEVRTRWDAADIQTRRAVIVALMDVTLLATPPHGRRQFDPATVRIEWSG